MITNNPQTLEDYRNNYETAIANEMSESEIAYYKADYEAALAKKKAEDLAKGVEFTAKATGEVAYQAAAITVRAGWLLGTGLVSAVCGTMEFIGSIEGISEGKGFNSGEH